MLHAMKAFQSVAARQIDGEEFLAIVRDIQDGKRVSQQELAARLGVSPPTARRYVREPGSMTMDSMRKLNRVLDVSAEDARANLAVK